MYAVLFDLDDTLYPEMAYVKSGFRAVAQSLTPDPGTQAELLNHMLELFELSPNGIFERLLERLAGNQWTEDTAETISRLVYVYRTHSPEIELYADVLPTITKLRRHGIQLGIITDGRADGQRAKLRALGVSELVDVVVITDSLGPNRRYWKPHTRPFEVALANLGVQPQHAVYVGDNPNKDFQGPARLGMRTVRIRRADALNLFARGTVGESNEFNADHVIDDLKALLLLMREWSWLQ